MNTPTWEFLASQILMPGTQSPDSPIENAFYRCFHYLMQGMRDSHHWYKLELQIECQKVIGDFRVDFLISKDGQPCLIVECDGHEFHASKEQLAKDKARDRDLAVMGYQVFRFTGSQLYADPFGCAAEAILFCQEAVKKCQAA